MKVLTQCDPTHINGKLKTDYPDIYTFVVHTCSMSNRP